MFLKKIVCKVQSGEMRFFRLERFFRGTRRSFRHRKQAKPSEPGPGKRESAANVFRSPLQYRCRLTLLGKQSAGWAAILKKTHIPARKRFQRRHALCFGLSGRLSFSYLAGCVLSRINWPFANTISILLNWHCGPGFRSANPAL